MKPTQLVSLALLAGFLGGCTEPDRNVYPADESLVSQRMEYATLPDTSKVSIASSEEPGRRLLVLGTLIQSETGDVVTNHPVTLYHADSTGSYGVGGENAARLSGTVVTDSLGRFLVDTILPAGYGSGEQILGSGHIHMAVEGAHPEAYDFYFMQGIGRGLLRWANGTDQAVVLDLKTLEDDTLITRGEVMIRGL